MPKLLGGEAHPDSWHFKHASYEGPLPNPVDPIFPIITHDESGEWRLIGTGFYISSDGLFVTARHVIDDVLKGDDQMQPLAIIHLYSESGLFGPQHFLVRPIVQCWLGEREDPDPILDPPRFLPRPQRIDLALGVAGEMRHNTSGQRLMNSAIALSWEIPVVGTSAATYAFPLPPHEGRGQRFSLRPDAYLGRINNIAETRGRSIPHAHYEVDFRIHGAASGAPVFGPDGRAIGVNSRELTGTGPGYATQIRLLEGAYLERASLAARGSLGTITFAELVDAGVIRADSYVAMQPPCATWGRVVHLNKLPTAEPPEIEVGLYF